MILLIFILIIAVPPVVLLATKKFKAFAVVIALEVLLFIWFAHPVCQVNNVENDPYRIYGVKVFSLRNPQDIVRYYRARNHRIFIDGKEAYCKSWIARWFFA